MTQRFRQNDSRLQAQSMEPYNSTAGGAVIEHPTIDFRLLDRETPEARRFCQLRRNSGLAYVPSVVVNHDSASSAALTGVAMKSGARRTYSAALTLASGARRLT